MRYAWYYALLPLFLFLTGCVHTGAPDDQNFTILLECAEKYSFPILVAGNAHVSTAALLASNCSLHINGDDVTIACPSRGLPEFEYPEWMTQKSESG